MPSKAELADAWTALSEGAAWVYADGLRDTDTRRLLLASEWARSHVAKRRGPLGDGALDSGRAAYGAYVKSNSKETLRALADLRKAVLEEAQKISQRAQDLAGSLWKDLSVAAAPFILKILVDAGKTGNHQGTGLLAIGAACFLGFSFVIQTRINSSFLKAQEASRTVWRTSLNTVLSPDEIKTFSDDPIGASEDTYNNTWWLIGVVYAVLIITLGVSARNSLSDNSQQTQIPPVAQRTP